MFLDEIRVSGKRSNLLMRVGSGILCKAISIRILSWNIARVESTVGTQKKR